MDNSNLKYSDITQRIIGCAMRVHAELGNGFQEVIYQRCMAIEMDDDGLESVREQEMPIFYKGTEVGMRRVDSLVEGCVLVEYKAVIALEPVHLAQAKNYLEAFNLDAGLLINFGAKNLEVKRLFNNKVRDKNSVFPENPVNPENPGSDK